MIMRKERIAQNEEPSGQVPRAVVTHADATIPAFVSDVYVLFDVSFVPVERGACSGAVGTGEHTSAREAEERPTRLRSIHSSRRSVGL